MSLARGCLCGSVRYRVDAEPYDRTNCHCSLCRRASAAPFVTWFSVARSGFEITRGEPRSYASSEHGTRSFCPSCGTPLTFASSRLPSELDVTTCSLDDPEALPPHDHTQTSARLRWLADADRLPSHLHARADGEA